MNYVNTLIFDGRKNTDFAFFHFRKLKYWLPDKIKRTAQPCGSWMFNFGRGGEIRTHGLLYPKQARYQTAPRPDNEFIIDDSSKFVNRKIKIVLSLGDYADITYVKRSGNGRQGVP